MTTNTSTMNVNDTFATDEQFENYLDTLCSEDNEFIPEIELAPVPNTFPLLNAWLRGTLTSIQEMEAVSTFKAHDLALEAYSMLSVNLNAKDIHVLAETIRCREIIQVVIETLTFHADRKTFGWCPGAGDRLDPTVDLAPGQGAAELCLYDDCALMDAPTSGDDDDESVVFGAEMDGDWWDAQFSASANIARSLPLTEEDELAGRKAEMSWEPNRLHLERVSELRDVCLDELLSRIQTAKSVQNLVKLIGEAGYLSAVAIAHNTGRWYTHMKARDGLSETITALPEGYRHFGLDYARYVLALNAATIRAAGIHSPEVDWSSRLGKLTYVVGDSKDEQRAKTFASKLTEWLAQNIHRSLKVKAIGTYPKAPSAEGDIWEHSAMQGDFLATESVEEKVLCPYCDSQGTLPNGMTCPACDGMGEGVAIELHARVLGMSISEFQGSFKPRTSYLEWFVGPLARCPSALVTTSDSQEVPVLPKRTIEVLCQGVVKTTGYAPISLTPAPYIEGWTSLNAMLASLVRI